ncbi:MAG: HAD family hydrolase [Ignavibacteriaceae bacterium]|nr:HAD family hydrolase [Ignavibacteriaceae bacterium]
MEAILFDFGGTLDTNGVHWSEKFWEIYQKYRVPVTKKEYEEAYVAAEKRMSERVHKEDDMMATLSNQVNLQFEYLHNERKINEYSRLADSVINSCYLDVIETLKITDNVLRQLKNNYKLGVVSNFYGNLEPVLKSLSIDKYFDAIIDSTVVKVNKPDPNILQVALYWLNTIPANAIVIGDSYDRDIIPAKKIGCKTIWLDGKSWNKPDDTSDADIIVHSINKLVDVIKSISI